MRKRWHRIKRPSELLPGAYSVPKSGWRGRIRTFNPLIQSQREPSGVLCLVGRPPKGAQLGDGNTFPWSHRRQSCSPASA